MMNQIKDQHIFFVAFKYVLQIVIMLIPLKGCDVYVEFKEKSTSGLICGTRRRDTLLIFADICCVFASSNTNIHKDAC